MSPDGVTGVVLDAGFLSDLCTGYRIEHEVLTDRWSWHAVTVNVPQSELVLAEREKPGRARSALELLLARCGPSVLIRPLDLPAVEAAGAMMRRYGLDDPALAHTAAIAVPSGWTVFTTDPGRYQPLAEDIDVFGLV
ncbi:PIN domain-containing protein [Streptomyces orinoci]|uniref:PIN domain-containing protein n=1 Tax=Streptomyces orinoci TaxID=67339 RepID=A0ABV3JZ53_STRON|nr:PIN domain-containing protein [Streptomyces orinoci]